MVKLLMVLSLIMASLAIPRINAEALPTGVPDGTMRVHTQTSLFSGHQTGASTIRTLAVGQQVTLRGVSCVSQHTNNRLPVRHEASNNNGWVNRNHVTLVASH